MYIYIHVYTHVETTLPYTVYDLDMLFFWFVLTKHAPVAGFCSSIDVVLSDQLHRGLSPKWEYWNHVDSVSDWTVLSLSAFLFLSEPELRPRLSSATPQRERDGRIAIVEREYFPKKLKKYCQGLSMTDYSYTISMRTRTSQMLAK